MRINKKALIYLLTVVIFSIPIILFPNKDMNPYISILAMYELIGAIIIIHGVGYPLFSLPILFALFTTIFHFGEAFLLAINRYDLFSYTNIDLAGNMEIYNEANLFAILVEGFSIFGITLKKPSINKQNSIGKIDENNEIDIAFFIGFILFLIGFFPTFINYFLEIKYIFAGNLYAGVREAVDIGPIGLLSNFYQVGVFLMLIGSKNHKGRARVILFFAVCFEFFCMLSGNRSSQILKIIAFLFIYFRIIKQISVKDLIVLIIGGYFSIALLYFISAYRNANIADLSLLKNRLLEVFSAEPMIKLLAQLGSNLNVVVLTLVSIPSYHNFYFGLTYIISWCAIYPNTGGLLGNIPNMYAYLNFLNTELPLGGSYIGELYFNFGWFGILFSVFVGMFIGWSSQKIEMSIIEKKWVQLGPLMVLFYSLLWWVRDYFFGWIFRTFWCSVAVAAIYQLLKKKRIRRVSLREK